MCVVPIEVPPRPLHATAYTAKELHATRGAAGSGAIARTMGPARTFRPLSTLIGRVLKLLPKEVPAHDSSPVASGSGRWQHRSVHPVGEPCAYAHRARRGGSGHPFPRGR